MSLRAGVPCRTPVAPEGPVSLCHGLHGRRLAKPRALRQEKTHSSPACLIACLPAGVHVCTSKRARLLACLLFPASMAGELWRQLVGWKKGE
eukprot:CAMPEP_0206426826 /NCGR_PEP_ID=MMETSP0324_2-20121206/4636_1 /ASSEMBLY_ACC=CAM_ASM_000836 /TAXON_ID=2866 /ORGANISM="Crypthecodinium cohnii, Strain Seligo" /LENGTH=91 /DNA_ID=CAMNT_0053891909 /DNA_START=390 /DNA_END=665 /DNA_ORIENTATION=+